MRSSLLLAAFLVAAPVFAGDQNEELQRLRGVWIPVSIEIDGKREAAAADSSVIIRDESWIEHGPAGDSASMINIDPSHNPKHIDRISGAMSLPGVYKLEGDALTVTIAIPIQHKISSRRPGTFTTKPGDPFGTFVYRRDATAKMPEMAQWGTRWNEAFATAKSEHQLVLVDYFATWCKPCTYMDATVFMLPDVNSKLEDFVLLRTDVDVGDVAPKHRVFAMPTYVIYDPSERERFRLTGALSPDDFRKALDAASRNAGAVLQASDLFDQKKDIEAGLLLGNTYSHMNMLSESREAYKATRIAADKEKQPGAAQMADALAAFTFARQGNPKHAIRLLEKLAATPANRDTEALIWLTMGNAQVLANDENAAFAAYSRALQLTAPDSLAHAEVVKAMAQLKR
jgi:uncharacterized protein (TIGR03067 family)